MTNSKLGSLHLNDFTKGLLVVVLGAALTAGQQAISSMLAGEPVNIPVMLHNVGLVSAMAGISYITKQLMTNSNGDILKKEPDTPKY